MVFKNNNSCKDCGRCCFFRREPSASGATGARLERPTWDVGWQLLAARGWRDFCFFFFRKRHDSTAAGGDEQASLILQPVDCERLKGMEAK